MKIISKHGKYLWLISLFIGNIAFATTTQDEVLELLYKHFPTDAVPAIAGNIAVESGFDYLKRNEGGGDYGLFQFNFQLSYYKTWLSENKKEDSAKNQILFVKAVIYSDDPPMELGGAKYKLRSGLGSPKLDVKEKTTLFMEVYEKPSKQYSHLDRRIAIAREISITPTPPTPPPPSQALPPLIQPH